MPELSASEQPTDGASVIDGKAFAARLRGELAVAITAFKKRVGATPGLAVVLVGEDPASQVYVRNKGRQTVEVGMESFEHRLPADTDEATVLARVESLNEDPAVNGILVQLPLPGSMRSQGVIDTITPAKDVDGFHVSNAGRLAVGTDAMVPCTPLGCLLMLRDTLGDLSGKRAVIIGRSNIVGKPMAQLLLRESCTVTIAHSRTRDIAGECRRADIVVAAVGRPEMVTGDWLSPGAVVIDVGINRVPSGKDDGKHRLVGDVDFASASRVAAHITPVPGGVGPMTIACLLLNTFTAACRQHGLDPAEFIDASRLG